MSDMAVNSVGLFLVICFPPLFESHDIKASWKVGWLALRRLSQRGDIGVRGDIVSLRYIARAEEAIAHRLRCIGHRRAPSACAATEEVEEGQISERFNAVIAALR